MANDVDSPESFNSNDSPGYSPGSEQSMETPGTSPPPSKEEVEVGQLDDSTRLDRIRYLVDQSKLYAQFLASTLESIKAEPAEGNGGEAKPEVNQAESDTKSNRRSKRGKAAKGAKQMTLGSIWGKNKSEKGQSSDSSGGESEGDGVSAKCLAVSLYPYQVIGVKWMVNLFENGLNGILADEMGLGKTLQVIAFLAYLMEHEVNGPFLIVAPLSTVGNWKNEISRFAPSIESCPYFGDRTQRQKLRKRYLASRKPKVPVFITSYEIVMADAASLNCIDWKYIIVDEGHRLKNINCKLMRELKKYSSANRLLLTGTPLQNNLTELWALLNFLLPDVFTDLDIFHSWFEHGGENAINKNDSGSLVTSLHSILRPFLLRRLKSEVDLGLPPKREYIIYTGLTKLQTELYQSILAGEVRRFVVQHILEERGSSAKADDVLSGNGNVPTDVSGPPTKRRRRAKPLLVSEDASDESEAESVSEAKSDSETAEEHITDQMIKAAKRELASKKFSNMVMQLRLACESPYLFWYPWLSQSSTVDKRIESTSGKLIVLRTLMTRLKKDGHKVLIFSQFTKMLDLLEDWCAYAKYSYLRLDGSTSQGDREEIMGEFGSDGSKVDLFLLSTRSGGQGVNLTAADTVIIFDSDYNPQQDLQAMDRVHRIGQTKPVLIFRLIAGDTVEQDLLQRANSKLELTNMVIERGNFKGIFGGNQAEQQETIRVMSQQLDHHRERFSGSSRLYAKDLNRILDRSLDAYRDAKENPELSNDIYCRSVEM